MHLELICRICLSEGSLKPLLTSECSVNNSNVTYYEMLKFCFDKQNYEADESPKYICVKCVSKLTSSYKFKLLVESSFMKIKEFLSNDSKHGTTACKIIDEESQHDNSEMVVDENDDGHSCNGGTSIHEDSDMKVTNRVKKVRHKKKLKEKKIKKVLKDKQIKTPYFCELCQKTFRNENLHKKRIHCERTPSQCERCAAIFLKPYTLSLHMRQHENNLPYPCEHPGCGKAYAIPSLLKQHMTSHTDDRPFVCQYCSHGARTKQQLIIHIRYHHTKEKNYKCSFCEKAFVSYQARYNHEKRHKNIRDHQCTHCDKSFVSAGNLVNHMLTHTGEKRFECRLCTTRFSRKAHRNNHEEFFFSNYNLIDQ